MMAMQYQHTTNNNDSSMHNTTRKKICNTNNIDLFQQQQQQQQQSKSTTTTTNTNNCYYNNNNEEDTTASSVTSIASAVIDIQQLQQQHQQQQQQQQPVLSQQKNNTMKAIHNTTTYSNLHFPYNKSASTFQDALKIHKNLDTCKLYQGAVKLGNHLMQLQKWNDALFCFRTAIEIKDSSSPAATSPLLNNEEEYAKILYSMGTIYTKLGDWENAIQAYEQCVEIRRNTGTTQANSYQYNMDMSCVLYQLASLYCHRENDLIYSSELLVEAVSILMEISIIDNNNNKATIFDALQKVWNALSFVQEKLGRFDDAKSSRNEALKFI